jgi:competence transcription factor ComK
MSDSIWVSALIVLCFIAAGFGNAVGHSTVARECERLGAFYVGNKTFTCHLKEVSHAE